MKIVSSLFGAQRYAIAAQKASTNLKSVMCIVRADVPGASLSRLKL